MLWPDSWWGRSLMIGCALLAFIPPKYDPAVRLKEWLMGDDKKW